MNLKLQFGPWVPCAGMCGTTGYEGEGVREEGGGGAGGLEFRCHAPAAFLSL